MSTNTSSALPAESAQPGLPTPNSPPPGTIDPDTPSTPTGRPHRTNTYDESLRQVLDDSREDSLDIQSPSQGQPHTDDLAASDSSQQDNDDSFVYPSGLNATGVSIPIYDNNDEDDNDHPGPFVYSGRDAQEDYDAQMSRILEQDYSGNVDDNGRNFRPHHAATSFRNAGDHPARPGSASTSVSSSFFSRNRPSFIPQLSRLRSAANQAHSSISSSSSLDRSHSSLSYDNNVNSSYPASSKLVSAPPPLLSSSFSSSSVPLENTHISTSVDPPLQEDEETFDDIDKVSHVRWASLRRIAAKVFHSQDRIRTLGTPTVLATSGVICIGTSKGWVTVYEYSQDLKCICGSESIIKESGAVTALSISSDHTFISVGHQNGYIYLYDLSTPATPARIVPTVSMKHVKQGRAEGHLNTSSIIHLSFVGARHTAIVSTDDHGLVFFHTLGKVLGLENTNVERILGRYPSDPQSSASKQPRQPILAIQPLPFGTHPHPSDSHALVAIMTPSRILVAGLKPKPRTWWRRVRSEIISTRDQRRRKVDDDNDEDLKSGALAWFPCFQHEKSSFSSSNSQNRNRTNDGNDDVVYNPVLGFAWSNVATFVRVDSLHVNLEKPGDKDSDKYSPNAQEPNAFNFHVFRKWTTLRPIYGLFWINRKVVALGMLNQIEVIDVDANLCIARTEIDPKSLPNLPSSLNNSTSYLFYRCFRTYKGRIFSLLSNDLSVGTIASWADRILSLVNTGEIIKAIDLMTAYHHGQGHPSITSLPEALDERQALVRPKLREILGASLDYVFSEERMYDGTHASHEGPGVDRTSLFEGLVAACAKSCIEINALDDFLFDEMVERYRENGIEKIFLCKVEPFIISGEIDFPPPSIIQALLHMHDNLAEYDAISKLIVNVNPACLDINLAITLCLRRELYDGLVNVYTRALEDFVSPLVQFIKLVRGILKTRRQPGFQKSFSISQLSAADGGVATTAGVPEHENVNTTLLDDSFADFEEGNNVNEQRNVANAYKIYPYLGDTLRGLIYPSKAPLSPESIANKARSNVYSFLFSGRSLVWPPKSGELILTTSTDPNHEHHDDDSDRGFDEDEPTYPYLRLLLRFDTEATLDMLDIAMEESYLDNEDVPGKPLNRQMIINLLLEIMLSKKPTSSTFLTTRQRRSSNRQLEDDANQAAAAEDVGEYYFGEKDRVFFYIFIARSLAKYPQFILLPSSTMYRILINICEQGDEDTREDRQLALEFLLSVYVPDDVGHALEMYKKARFYRIVRSILWNLKRWDEMVEFVCEDDDISIDEKFKLHEDIFKEEASLLNNDKRKEALKDNYLKYVRELFHSNSLWTVQIVEKYMPEIHPQCIEKLLSKREDEYVYLAQIYGNEDYPLVDLLEPSASVSSSSLSLSLSLSSLREPRSRRPFPEPKDNQKRKGTESQAQASAFPSFAVEGIRRAKGKNGNDNKDDLELRLRYLDLLCEYSPSAVITFLQRFMSRQRGEGDGEDGKGEMEKMKDVCRKWEVFDAVVWIVSEQQRERSLDTVTPLVNEVSRDCINSIIQMAKNNWIENGVAPQSHQKMYHLGNQLMSTFSVGIALCSAHSNDERKSNEDTWVALFSSMVNALSNVSQVKDQEDVFVDDMRIKIGELMKDGVYKMSESAIRQRIRLPRLMRKIIERSENDEYGDGDGGEKGGHYSEYRAIVSSMLEIYRDGERMLGLSGGLVASDVFELVKGLESERKKGWRANVFSRCGYCSRQVFAGYGDVVSSSSSLPWQSSSATTAPVDIPAAPFESIPSLQQSLMSPAEQVASNSLEVPFNSSPLSASTPPPPTITTPGTCQTPHTPIEEIVPPPRSHLKSTPSLKGKEVVADDYYYEDEDKGNGYFKESDTFQKVRHYYPQASRQQEQHEEHESQKSQLSSSSQRQQHFSENEHDDQEDSSFPRTFTVTKTNDDGQNASIVVSRNGWIFHTACWDLYCQYES